MMILLVSQLGVPLLLAGWFIMRPPLNRIAFVAQLVGSLAILLAIARFGLWLFPPWWTPYAVCVILLVGAVFAVRRRPLASGLPRGIERVVALIFVAASVAGLVFSIRAALARSLPDNTTVVNLEFPMRNGSFLIVNGGTDVLVNAHLESLDSSIVRLQPWRGNAYAVDIVDIDRMGSRAPGVVPRDPTLYRIFGMPVMSPCDGVVIVAKDGHNDMPVPEYDRDNMAGNHVIVRCAEADVVLAHFRKGSIQVEVGSSVNTGMVIGEVGNSGGTNEPHLHIHAQRPGTALAPMSGDPLPMLLNGRFLVRSDRIRQ